MTYATGHIKRNSDTGEVALRTIFPEEVPESLWLVSTVNKGPYMTSTDKVEGWIDLYTPPTAE